ncbi:MAG: hypothetical protein HDR88_01225 [Bacteroides sp.]|nr:hypothetical protein [Bacteroides sp.]
MNYSKSRVSTLTIRILCLFLYIIFPATLQVFGASENTKSSQQKNNGEFESTVWWKTILSDSLENKDLRITAADSLLVRTPNDIDLLTTKINLLKEKGDMVAAVDLYEEILRNPEIKIDISRKLRMEIDQLYLLQSVGRYSSVILNAHEYLTQRFPDSLLYLELPIRMFMMNVAVVSHQKGVASKYLEEARSVCESLKEKKNSPENVAYAYRQLLKGDIIYSIHSGNFNRILMYVDSVRSIGEESSIEDFLDMCLPIAYDGMGQKDYAENLYVKTLAKPASPDIRLANIKNYASFLLKYDRPDEALSLIDNNYNLPEWMKKHPSYVEFIAIRGKALGALKRYEEAYRCMDLYRTMTDSINAQERQGDALFGIEQLKVSDKLESEKRRAHNFSIALIITVVICLLIIAALFMCVRKIMRYKKRVDETDATLNAILVKNQEKLEASNEKIAGQQRELVGRGLEVARMSGVVAQLNEIIADSTTEAQEKLNAIKVALREFKTDKDIWETFRIYFELTQPAFINNLREKCPDLTQKEIRMCAFVLMNLTTKEIAKITSRVPRSVETMKYRLAKKLDVPAGETLHKFLSGLSG